MRRTRVIPVLLLRGNSLYKSVQFKNHVYVGDPINAVKIFNDKGIDELIVLDTMASSEQRVLDLGYLREFAEECFAPMGYGGGIRSVADVEAVLRVGVEKVAINTAALDTPSLIRRAADAFGSQSIVGAIDVKKTILGKRRVARTNQGVKTIEKDPITYARELVELGAGEIFLNSVDRDGTGNGYDLELIKGVADAVQVPLIACGGAGCVDDFRQAIDAGASAVAAGQMFVFYGRHRAVLINYPESQQLDDLLP